MYLLEWNLGSTVAHTWAEVTSHPMYHQATIYHWVVGLGWCE